MYYSNIRSRAGLAAPIFALIISLVSAVPIPVTESRLSSTFSPPSSNPSLNHRLEQDHHIQLNTTKISLSGRMSTLPAATRALTRKVRYSSLSRYLLDSIYWAWLTTFITAAHFDRRGRSATSSSQFFLQYKPRFSGKF